MWSNEEGMIFGEMLTQLCLGLDGAIILTESVISRLILRRGRSRVRQRRFFRGMMRWGRVRDIIVCLRRMDRITILFIIVGMLMIRLGIIAWFV